MIRRNHSHHLNDRKPHANTTTTIDHQPGDFSSTPPLQPTSPNPPISTSLSISSVHPKMNPSSPPSILHHPSLPLLTMDDLASTSSAAAATVDDHDTSLPFEWTELFDFSLDDDNNLLLPIDLPFPPPENPIPIPNQVATVGNVTERTDRRVRKRDPRLVCENYLAGRIPCACPEMDAAMEAAMEAAEAEEVEASGKKRARRGREGGGGGVVRCQVPGCEVDIRELKGYHRRHRVCLRCANATEAVIGGEGKRYCQQCGKFHVLTDFDEGKRSCRRKLERHNNRRRRKSLSTGSTQNEAQGDLLFEDVSSDGEAGRVNICSTNQITADDEREASLDQTNANASNICSALDSQNMQRSSVASFEASRETVSDRGKDNSNYDRSPSYCNKSAYSSMCPTGRISFKLYDWNPAEFPRRLRHQIFQWLASMPVELEGYIRPGCTILTAFISMPQFAWTKLLEDPASCLRDFLAPGRMLCGRGTAFVYLNNKIFGVLRDGTSVVTIDVAVRAPKLHYVYPSCFEAGKPMEFIACGSNLLQSKFRSLVSFSGKYLPHDYRVVFPHGKDTIGTSPSFNNQLLRINIPYTEPECFGPAFIEVENESGLSNFLPILIADEEVCSEVMTLHHKYAVRLLENRSQLEADIPARMRETEFSDLILDIAWLLKEPPLEETQHASTSMQLQRFNYLLNFLIRNKSIPILERLHKRLTKLIDENGSVGLIDGTNDADMLLFQKHMAQAGELVCQKLKVECILPKSNSSPASFADTEVLSISSAHSQDMELEAQHQSKHCRTLLGHSSPQRKYETDPLLNIEVPAKLQNARTRDPCNPMIAKQIISSRSLFYLFAAAVVCCGVCAVLLHPSRSRNFVVTIRRCLFDGSF